MNSFQKNEYHSFLNNHDNNFKSDNRTHEKEKADQQNDNSNKESLKENRPAKQSSYHPDPKLLRRLIENTSFDHREKKIIDQKRQHNNEEKTEMNRKNMPEIFSTKRQLNERKTENHTGQNWIKKSFFGKNSLPKKKKFLKKERENRLSDLVNQVLQTGKNKKNQEDKDNI